MRNNDAEKVAENDAGQGKPQSFLIGEKIEESPERRG